MGKRECPFCGKHISSHLTQCVFCRETLPVMKQAPRNSGRSNGGGTQVRRGLLFMLLAAIIGYFAGGYSAMKLPFPLNPLLTTYLSPLLFLSGLGLSIHGYYLHHKSHHKSSLHNSI